MILEIIYAGGIGILVYILVNYLIQLSELKKYPPGPIPLPIIGNIHLLGRKPHESLVQLSKKYGPVMSITFGTQRLVVFNAIEQAREALLKKGEDFAGRPQDIHAAAIATDNYNNIGFADYGAAWKMMRKMAHASMRMYGAAMEDLEENVSLEIEELFNRFDQKIGTPFDPHHDLALGVLNIICSIICGTRYDVNDEEFKDVIEFNNNIMKGFDNASFVTFIPWLRFFPNKGLSMVKKGVEKRDRIMKKKFEEHKKTFDPNNLRDLTDALLNEFQNEEKANSNANVHMTEKRCQMILCDLFIAGSETTTTTLLWAMLYLATWQDIQRKLSSEMKDVIGDRQPCLADRSKLNYFEATIHEIMRLSSLAPLGGPHKTVSDTEIDGYKIPKGTQVWFNIWAYHYDQRHWKEPESFKPERWLNDEGEFVPGAKKSYLPFGAGRRACLGESMAKVEIFLFLSNIVYRYEIQQVPGEDPPDREGIISFTNSPKPFSIVLKKKITEQSM